jgi:hypothetical protein
MDARKDPEPRRVWLTHKRLSFLPSIGRQGPGCLEGGCGLVVEEGACQALARRAVAHFQKISVYAGVGSLIWLLRGPKCHGCGRCAGKDPDSSPARSAHIFVLVRLPWNPPACWSRPRVFC